MPFYRFILLTWIGLAYYVLLLFSYLLSYALLPVFVACTPPLYLWLIYHVYIAYILHRSIYTRVPPFDSYEPGLHAILQLILTPIRSIIFTSVVISMDSCLGIHSIFIILTDWLRRQYVSYKARITFNKPTALILIATSVDQCHNRRLLLYHKLIEARHKAGT